MRESQIIWPSDSTAMNTQKTATAAHGILPFIGLRVPYRTRRRARPRQAAAGCTSGAVRCIAPHARGACARLAPGGFMRRVYMLMIAALAAAPAPARAQAQPAAPQTFTLSGNGVRGYQNIQRNLLEAAEKMPEADYAFKPTAEVRPFGQLVAHVALSQFGTCAALKGDAAPPHKEDKEETT